MKYSVFYKDIKIGTLYINEEDKYKYVPNLEVLEEVKAKVSLIHEMCEETDWRDPIPFFKNRIEDAKKIGQEDDISRSTDFYRMVKEE